MQRNTESKNPTVSKTADGKAMLLFQCKMQKLKIFQRIGGQGIVEAIRNQNSFEKGTII